MPHRLPTTLLVIRTGVLPLVVLAGLAAAPHGEGSSTLAATAPPTQVQRLIERHDCSTTGFDTEVPSSALVRSADGSLRLVGYSRDLFSRARAGEVLAVCLDAPSSGSQWLVRSATP